MICLSPSSDALWLRREFNDHVDGKIALDFMRREYRSQQKILEIYVICFILRLHK